MISMPLVSAFGANNTLAPKAGPATVIRAVNRLCGVPGDTVSQAIPKSNDALPRFATKVKLKMVAEKLVTVAAHAVKRQAVAEKTKRPWNQVAAEIATPGITCSAGKGSDAM